MANNAQPGSACSRAAWDFSRVEELWGNLEPLTPYGKDEKEKRAVLGDRSAIEKLYDGTDAVASMIRERGRTGDRASLDRISFHLGRTPRLPFGEIPADPGTAGLELIEIFQSKKFLANYRALFGLLDPMIRERFGFPEPPVGLGRELDRGGSDPETFFIADSYHPELAATRATIERLDEALRAIRSRDRARAALERRVDFAGRDFLVLRHDEARPLLESEAGGPRFSVEAYDGRSCVVRLLPSEEELLAGEEREAFLARERELESEVLATLSRLIAASAAQLLACAGAVRDFDLARARAVLALKLGLSRPRLDSAELAVEGARFLPCEADCLRLGLVYTPLDVRVVEPVAVIFGSNMGGKTVALQTLLFLQIAAQAGLHVPAASFRSSVYAALEYAGELRGGRGGSRSGDEAAEGGLSGFGFEIRTFEKAWEAAEREGAFLVFDEFARTTGSLEAESILSAAIGALAALRGARSLFSTHFHGIERVEGARFLRMRGLDREAARAAMAGKEPLGERIRLINRMMRYELVDEDRGEDEGSDAIAIAALLGLDGRIAERAESLFAGKRRCAR